MTRPPPQPHIDTLVDWATHHGATLHPSVHVCHFADTGLSLRLKPTATAARPPDEPLVRIPAALTLSYLDLLADDSPERLPDTLLPQTPPHVLGRLFLVQQLLRGEASFWWPYIQALPPRRDTDAWALPPYWPSEDVALFQGTNLEVGIRSVQEAVAEELRRVSELLRVHAPRHALREALTARLYHWACCVFSSRSFRPSLVLTAAHRGRLPAGIALDDFSVLLPLFDIGNHDMTASVRWHIDERDQACELHVAGELAPGDQVFNNYGMKTNAELLLGYSFMLPATESMHSDYVHVRKRAASTSSPAAAADEYLISLHPLAHRSSFLARARQPPRGDPWAPVLAAFQHVQPAMVWDIFCAMTTAAERARMLPDDDAAEEETTARQQACLAGHVTAEARPHLEQTIAVIRHKLAQELDRLDETDVEVSEEQRDCLTRQQRLALEYRTRCRCVLESALQTMDRGDG